MLREIKSNELGKHKGSWLESLFHFSFAGYIDPNRDQFGILRVLNDDLIKAKTGFDTHPHKDMEIVTYVVDGEITHADSMGNGKNLSRGEVQYMTAGTGIYHSEFNKGNTTTRILQTWILPNKNGLTPNYGDYEYRAEDRANKWLNIASGNNPKCNIKLNADVDFNVIELDKEKSIKYLIGKDRQGYLVQIEGSSEINGFQLEAKDALETIEEDIEIVAKDKSHIMIIEMKKEV